MVLFSQINSRNTDILPNWPGSDHVSSFKRFEILVGLSYQDMGSDRQCEGTDRGCGVRVDNTHCPAMAKGRRGDWEY